MCELLKMSLFRAQNKRLSGALNIYTPYTISTSLRDLPFAQLNVWKYKRFLEEVDKCPYALNYTN